MLCQFPAILWCGTFVAQKQSANHPSVTSMPPTSFAVGVYGKVTRPLDRLETLPVVCCNFRHLVPCFPLLAENVFGERLMVVDITVREWKVLEDVAIVLPRNQYVPPVQVFINPINADFFCFYGGCILPDVSRFPQVSGVFLCRWHENLFTGSQDVSDTRSRETQIFVENHDTSVLLLRVTNWQKTASPFWVKNIKIFLYSNTVRLRFITMLLYFVQISFGGPVLDSICTRWSKEKLLWKESLLVSAEDFLPSAPWAVKAFPVT